MRNRLLAVGAVVVLGAILVSVGTGRLRRSRAEERAMVGMGSMKSVADAVMRHVMESDGQFPQVQDEASLVSSLGKYVPNRDAFLHPENKDEVVVAYVLPPDVGFVDIQDPMNTPVVVADYDPDYLFVGYCDGHAEALERTDGTEQRLGEWVERLKKLRRDDPNAPLPPFVL